MAENGPMPSANPLAFVEEVFSFYLRRSSKSLVFDKFNQIDLEIMAVSLSIRMRI